jgi:hypothetical protein
VRNVQELAVALGLGESHKPWRAKVPEDLRFVVKGLYKLAYFRRSRDTCHLDAIHLVHVCHHLCPYPRGEGHKDGVNIIDGLGAVNFRYEAVEEKKKDLPRWAAAPPPPTRELSVHPMELDLDLPANGLEVATPRAPSKKA